MPDRTISEAKGTLGSLLRRPYEALQHRIYGRLAERGFADVRPAHSSVFRYILPKGSRVSDLAERAGMTKQSMAYLAQSLTELGYTAISPDPDDGRAKLVTLTERGEAVWRALVDLSAEAETEAADLLGPDRLTALRADLAALAAALEDR
jgi:DNA-binding MarR family transcriptional regulator